MVLKISQIHLLTLMSILRIVDPMNKYELRLNIYHSIHSAKADILVDRII